MTVLKTYPLKVNEQWIEQLMHLEQLVHQASTVLLHRLWSEEWLEILSQSSLKAYKVIGEAKVILPNKVYLPSRIRRGVVERVGEVLRSQYRRMVCFNNCLQVTEHTGLTGNLDRLVRQVAKTLQVLSGKFYRYSLLRQTLRQLRRLHLKYNLDVWSLRYCDATKPKIRQFILPYGPDDGQAIQYRCDGKSVWYRLKLPKIASPKTRYDWLWVETTYRFSQKLQNTLAFLPDTTPRRPLLRKHILKGGLPVFVLQFPWIAPTKSPTKTTRFLAVDLGLINLATLVICDAGYQVSPPIFIRNKRMCKIDRLYKNITGLQCKLDRWSPHRQGYGSRSEEYLRVYRKLRRVRLELAHAISNAIIHVARTRQCSTILLEDLRSFAPPKGKRKTSRRLNHWLRGKVLELVSYKCSLYGLCLRSVPAWGTSSYCPRCGARGQKVKASTALTNITLTGRFFHCPSCNFQADRDYVGALNVYRASFIQRETQKNNLREISPVLYRSSGTPLDRPSGGTTMIADFPGLSISQKSAFVAGRVLG